MPSTCFPSVLHSARGAALRGVRSIVAARNAVLAYDNEVLSAATYFCVATGMTDGTGAALVDDAMTLAISDATAAQPLASPPSGSGAETLDYSTVDAITCPTALDLIPRAEMLQNADTMIQLQFARMSERYAPMYANETILDNLRSNDSWAMVKHALRCYHALERIGMHQTVVDALLTLFADAQTLDTFTPYDTFTRVANTEGFQSPGVGVIDDDPSGFVPANTLAGSTMSLNLLVAVATLYAATTGVRSIRYSITAAHPPFPLPPPPSGRPFKC